MAFPARPLDLTKIGGLTFETPDPVRFPALRLAREALRIGGSTPTVLNAANEIAVQAFLGRTIGFLDIARVVEMTLERMPYLAVDTLETVLSVDKNAREEPSGVIARMLHQEKVNLAS